MKLTVEQIDARLAVETRLDWRVLLHLYRAALLQEDVTLADLAARLGVDEREVADAHARLSEQGYTATYTR